MDLTLVIHQHKCTIKPIKKETKWIHRQIWRSTHKIYGTEISNNQFVKERCGCKTDRRILSDTMMCNFESFITCFNSAPGSRKAS